MTDSYCSLIRSETPVGYWRLNERSQTDQVVDESGNGHHGTFSVTKPTLGQPGAIKGSANCSMGFASQAFIEIPHSEDFSIQTSGEGLSVEVWMRPEILQFPGEPGKSYIHWLGKGEARKMEWGFRLYSSDHSERPKRISAYAWNPQGGEGAGAYCKGELVKQNVWIHLVACFQHYVHPSDRKGVLLFVNGKYVQGPPSSGTLYFNEGSWSVVPRGRNAPLRFATRSANDDSFLTGSIDEVAIYPKVLTHEQIKRHYEVGMGS